MAGKLSRRLSAQDAAFLYFEKPQAPLHIGSLGVYEGRIPFERFVDQIASRMPMIPRYRQRVTFVPFSLELPTWDDDPAFDVRNHIHHIALAAPGDDRQLRELTAELFSQPLDRGRPLWEMYVIDGLKEGNTGIVSKVHHCMVDGVSGIELLLATLDLSPEPAPPPEDDGWNPQALPGPVARLTDAFWEQLNRQREIALDIQQAFLDPVSRFEQGQEILRALNLASTHIGGFGRRAPFSTRLGQERCVAFSEMSFVEIREIRASLGGTVNDVVLTILAGALRLYLRHHGDDVASIEPAVAIPVNVRVEGGDPALGNRVSFMVTALPLGEADASARLQRVRDRMDLLKKENQASGLERLVRLAARIPAPAQALAGQFADDRSLVDLICTNVPGPMIPLYSLGHLLLQHYPLVPLSFDMGLGVGVMSYNHRLYFGLMAHPAAVPDIERLKECVDQSFLELRRAAGVDTTDLPALDGSPARNGTQVVQEASVGQGSG
ncbi:MAG: wax ester/triacylglycerol synthase family O-acyltransferase [Chloroflexi bacterium]|nr:wax ester/triacylglycerol synthase family O-acyltransferase [Chloroflexota bacterium]